MNTVRDRKLRLVATVAAVGASVLVAACGSNARQQIKEQAGTAVDTAKSTAGAEVKGTVQAGVEGVAATVQAKTTVAVGTAAAGIQTKASGVAGTVVAGATGVSATVESAAGQAKGTAGAVASSSADLKAWATSVAGATSALANQASELKADPMMISADPWRSATQEALTQLGDLADQGSQMASELSAADAMPKVGTALGEASSAMTAAVDQLQKAFDDYDAATFMADTDGLSKLNTLVDLLTKAIDAVGGNE